MRVNDRFDLVLREAEAAEGMTRTERRRCTWKPWHAAIPLSRPPSSSTCGTWPPDGRLAGQSCVVVLVRCVNGDDSMKPERIGDYQVIRWLGGGGFGDVYHAQPLPGVIAPENVAIKLLKPGLHTPEILARFRREEKILAQLTDDRIARLISGGNHDGLPYFVMEYVEGQPFTAHCDGRRLPTRERLALFGRVCLAIQHAHDVGVIHCDLKPANILVTAAACQAARLRDRQVAPHRAW